MTDALAGLYQQVILDHAKRRHGDVERGHPELPRVDAEHFERNPTCGDEITVRIVVDTEGRIADLGWRGTGCSISMASASVLSGLAPGLTLEQALDRVDVFREMMRSKGAGDPDEDLLGDAVAFHGVSRFVLRVKCASLAWVALEACVREVAAART